MLTDSPGTALSVIANIISTALKLLLITVVALEIALQLAFPLLPPNIIRDMPQYEERLGFRLETEHGVHEFPALQNVHYNITTHFGDLFDLTCVEPADVPPFEPYEVSFQRDSHGFRNAEPWREDVSLVVLGDSFTNGASIQRPFWQDLAESMLVLAVPGTGTLEHQRIFDAFALPRQPETVVLAFFSGNDLEDSQRFHDMLRQGMTRRDLAHRYKNPHEYTVLFHLLLHLGEGATPGSTIECHYPVIAQTNPPTPLAFFRMFLNQLGEDEASLLQSEKLRLVKTSISEMASALAAESAELILMYIPHKAELYWRHLDAATKEKIIAAESRDRKLTGLNKIDDNLATQREVMRNVADEIGIDFLDLTPHFSAAIDAGAQPFFLADTHWNQQGHNIARNALLDFLNQSNLEK